MQPAVNLQSDALIFWQLVSNWMPEQRSFQRQPFCDVHEYWLDALHELDEPLHELDDELQ